MGQGAAVTCVDIQGELRSHTQVPDGYAEVLYVIGVALLWAGGGTMGDYMGAC